MTCSSVIQPSLQMELGWRLGLDVAELQRLSPRSLNHHVLQDTSNTCSTGSSASVYIISIYGWKIESIQHSETVKTSSAVAVDDTYA